MFADCICAVHTHQLEFANFSLPCEGRLKAETHDAANRCDTSARHVAATNRLVWHVKIIVAATEFYRYDLSYEFKMVWTCATYGSGKISPSSLVAACLRFCNKSLRQNLNQRMRKDQLFSRRVNFEQVYISSLPKSIACTEQESYRSDSSQHQGTRGDLSPRCVAAICRIVCLDPKERARRRLIFRISTWNWTPSLRM